MKQKNSLVMIFILCVSIFLFTGCSRKTSSVDFSEVNNICELATLKCYYHNVAKDENDAKGLLKTLNIGYKKIWIEYSGIVEYGIDVNKVSISQPNAKGVVQVTIPEAEVLNVDFDETSLEEPVTDKGFLTSITTEEKTQALAAAQNNMEESAWSDSKLLMQAQQKAKDILEAYVKNVGKQMGQEYTVEWKESE